MTGSAYPDEDRLVDYANAALEKLHGLLVNAGFGDYAQKSYSFSSTAGTEEYALPADFFKCLRLFRLFQNRRYEVHQFNLADLNGLQTSGVAADSFELLYAPRWARMTSRNAEIPIYVPTEWEEYAVLGIARRLLMRENSDQYQTVRAEERAEQERIVQLAEPRDAGGVHQVEDAYGKYTVTSVSAENANKYRYRIMGNNIWLVESSWEGV